jgi:agmatine deiminase
MKLPKDPDAPLPSLTVPPAGLGFRMPAEWEKHEATWLAWPHNQNTWPGKRLGAVEEICLQIIEALLPGEKIHLLVNHQQEEDYALNLIRKRIENLKNLFVHQIPTINAWIRDYGPLFLKKGANEKAWCKWRFNAWGNKYEDHLQDNEVFEKNAELIPFKNFKIDMVLEGGSIEVNGSGTCLTSEQCLLNKNRNPELNRKEIEKNLKENLGLEHVIWVEGGIQGDDTDGHIDDTARFVNATTILAAYEEDPEDENSAILKKNWERLLKTKDQDGKKWNLIKLPMPGKIIEEGRRLPASYANFYIGNSAVLIPVYGDEKDEKAVGILKDFFPDRRIVPIPCRDLVFGSGAIHCITQQEPATLESLTK